MHLIRHPLALVLVAGLSASALACGSDGVVLPGDNQAARISVADGAGQQALAGAELERPVVVVVSDEQNRPVEGQAVVFVLAAGGHATPDTARTDARGHASARWTLGDAAGNQQLRAEVVGAHDLSATVSATATAGDGVVVGLAGGDDQTGSVGSALAESLVVRVSDGRGNPVGGVAIEWTALGGGSVSPAAVVTGSDGRAAVERVLGPTAGPQSTEARAPSIAGSLVTFHHTADAATPTELLLVSGDAQAAPAGFALADSLVVRLVDADGNGVGGRAVTWVVATGGGSVGPVTSTTSPQGYAYTRWTLGPKAGTNLLNAVFSGLPSVPFTATGTADVPTQLVKVSGDDQVGTAGAALPLPLAVKVTDAAGNPVADVSVSWTADGGGSVSASTSGTDQAGVARITRTMGTTPGVYTTTAAVAGLTGSPVTFTATVVLGAAAKLVLTRQPAAIAVSGAVLDPQPIIQVTDLAGNPVPSANRKVAVNVGDGAGATLGGASVTTDGQGRATFTALKLTGSTGLRTLLFSTKDLAAVESEPVALVAGIGAALVKVAGDDQTAVAGSAVTIAPSVRITDASGNPVPGLLVTFAVTAGGGSLVGGGALTDADGTAAVGSWILGPTAGSSNNKLTASAPGVGSVTFTASAIAGPAARLAFTAAPTTAAAGQVIAPAVVVTLYDALDNVATGAAGSVSLELADNPSGATLGGTVAASVSNGAASFGDLTLDLPGSGYTLRASFAGLGPVTSTQFDVTP